MADSSRYPQTMAFSPTRALAAAFIALAIVAAPAGALPVTYDGIAADGHLALFNTAEKMVPGDTDNEQDVYVRAFDAGVGEYVTREVSIGPLGGNDAYSAIYDGVSSDGSRVFFSTKEPLVTADGDHREDVYLRDLATNTTTLVTQGDASCAGEGCGNGAADSSFVPGGVVPSGGRLFFATTEKLAAGDNDSALDVYMRNLAGGKTVLVSRGDSSCSGSNCGNGSQPAVFEAASEDGERAFFTSTEGLVSGDADGKVDIYERDLGGGETKLVSVAGTCPPSLPEGQTCDPTFGGVSSDGSHVFFESDERISEADEDSSQDVYDWSGSGTPVLVSTGPNGGNGAFNATYSGTGGASGAVYFETSEVLVAADEDSAQDVYVRSEGATELVSTGPESRNGPAPASFQWASPDGSRAIFSTGEALVPADTDAVQDVYERDGGETTLVSTGPEGGNGGFSSAFAKASGDGSHVFFVTAEQLVEEDEDEIADIYLRGEGETALVSTGPIGGNGAFSSGLHGVSGDGSKAFFVTRERLAVDDDFASEDDVYSWTLGKSVGSPGQTLLVSVKNSSELVLGPPPPFLEGTNPASPAETTEPSLFGQAEAGATITVYTNSSCSGEAVPPGGDAEELAATGIPVSVKAGTKTTFYATAELEGIVSPCSNGVTYVQQEATPPPPPKEEEKEGPGGGGGPGGGSGGGLEELEKIGPGGGQNGSGFVTPQVTITFGPASKTKKHKVVFRFADATGQLGTKFVCKLDRHRWKGCGSPKRLKKLHLGRHTFAVKAVNQLGIWDEVPAKRRFKVVR
jgi:hypothetical protein